MVRKYFENDKRVITIGLLLLAVIACFPIIMNHLKVGHDIWFHLGRIEGIAHGIAQGSFPLRIDTTKLNGFGYISPMMYPELFLALPALLRVLGFDIVSSYRFFLVAIQLATIFIAFYSFKRIIGKDKIALLATYLYVLSPYRLTNIYTRASIGEILAMIFIPLLLLGLVYLIEQDKNCVPIIILAGTGIFQSHMISCEIMIGFSVLFLLLNYKKIFNKESMICLGKILIGCLVLNLWFIIPLITMLGANLNISHYSYDVAYNALSINALFSFTMDELYMFLTCGFVVYLGVFCYLFFLRKKPSWFLNQFYVIGILLLFLTTKYFPWDSLQVSNIGLVKQVVTSIQFPWRFLGLATCLLSITGSYALVNFAKDFKLQNLMLAISVSFVLFESTYDVANLINDVNIQSLENVDYSMQIGAGEYLFNGLNHTQLQFINDDEVTIEDGTVNLLERKDNHFIVEFNSSNNDENYIEFPIFGYPGYAVKMNGEPWYNFSTGKDYRLRVFLEGVQSGEIEVYYEGRKLDKIALGVSIIGVIGWILIWVKRRMKNVNVTDTKKNRN